MMIPKIVFSIVLPVHNGQNYLAHTLDSILSQDYPHFKLMVLENASTDDTRQILASCNDPRIQVIPSESFLPVEENWARIVHLDLNEYLCIFCHDDPMFPGYLTEIVRLIEEYPDASLYQTHLHIIDGDGNLIKASFPVPLKESADDFLNAFNRGQREVIGSGQVMRSADFKRVGGLPPFYKLHFADVICYYKLTQLSFKVCSPHFLYGYRAHATSFGGSISIHDAVFGGKNYLDALKPTPYFQKPEQAVLARHFVKRFIFSVRQMHLVRAVYGGESHDFPSTYPKIMQQVRALVAGSDESLIEDRLDIRIYELLLHVKSLRLRTSIAKLLTQLAKRFIRRSDIWE